jgi:hypothetical protein
MILVDKQLRDKERVESALESDNVKEAISQMLTSESGYASTEYHHNPENLVRSYSKQSTVNSSIISQSFPMPKGVTEYSKDEGGMSYQSEVLSTDAPLNLNNLQSLRSN